MQHFLVWNCQIHRKKIHDKEHSRRHSNLPNKRKLSAVDALVCKGYARSHFRASRHLCHVFCGDTSATSQNQSMLYTLPPPLAYNACTDVFCLRMYELL